MKKEALFDEIIGRARENSGEQAPFLIQTFLQAQMTWCRALYALSRDSESPAGLILFKDSEIVFLYVREGDGQEEIARRLVTEAVSIQQNNLLSHRITSTFPSLKQILGQDLLSPLLGELHFTELHLAGMTVEIDSPLLQDYFASRAELALPSPRYRITQWNSEKHKTPFLTILLKNPAPLTEFLFPSVSREGLEWVEEQTYKGELGNTYIYCPKCSPVIEYDGFPVGALLCTAQGWLSQLGVDRSHEHLGLAAIIMREAWNAYRKSGVPSMSLSVFRENTKPYGWYKRMGFQEKIYHSVWAWKK
jgi:ribosomal protein S18 acetylase RimI-like enzyme